MGEVSIPFQGTGSSTGHRVPRSLLGFQRTPVRGS